MSELLYANRLQELRKKARLSLQELADSIGMSKQHVFQLENAEANPTIKTAYKLAAVLGVPVTEIWVPQIRVVEETITVRRIRGV